jgi:hypothetical protein
MNKKTRTAFYSAIVLVFIIGVGFVINQSPSKPISGLLTATVGGGTTNPYANLQKGFGYNTEGLVRTFEQFISNQNSRTAGTTLARQSSSTVLRFPGGNVGNFYHPQGNGYGYIRSEIPNNSFYNASFNWSATQTENLIYPFMRYAKDMGVNRILYVANVYTGNINEAIFVIDTFQKNGFTVVGVELGNEFYYKPFIDKIKTGQNYANIVRPFATELKSRYPGIPLAVAAWEHTGAISEKMGFLKINEWNKAIANIPGIDAFAIHKYANIRSCESQTNLINTFNCVKNLTHYEFHDWGNRLVDYHTGFNSSKRLWFTEFNVEDSSKRVGNTFLHAANIYEILLQTFNTKFANSFDFVIHHNFIATGRGMAAFYREGTGNTLGMSAQAYAIGMYQEVLGRAIRPSTAVINTNINLSDANTKKDFVYRLIETPTGHVLMFINKSDKPVSVSVLNGRNTLPVINQNVIGGPDLWSAIDGKPAYRDNGRSWAVSLLAPVSLRSDNNIVQIPKYHLGWIEFQK